MISSWHLRWISARSRGLRPAQPSKAASAASTAALASSIVADEAFYDLDGPPVRITTPHIPLPAADILEDAVLPTPARIAETVRKSLNS
jgi:pyruvate/2-oxoglutarate/acetoin dehydrogenase E1 component